MSTPTTPTLAAKLAAIYPQLKLGTDYGLNRTGDAISFWKPFRGDIPTLAELDAAYPAALAKQQRSANIAAAEVALVTFWDSLTPVQQKPLLGDYTAVPPLSEYTAAKLLLIADIAATVTGLSPTQDALKSAAITACAAIASAA